MARDAEPNRSAAALRSFEDLIALAAEKRDLGIKSALERDVRLVRFEDGKLEIGLEPSAAKMLVSDLSRKLAEWTGRRWMVAVSSEQGAPSNSFAERNPARPSSRTACAPIRWYTRFCRAFPAPRSSMCVRAWVRPSPITNPCRSMGLILNLPTTNHNEEPQWPISWA